MCPSPAGIPPQACQCLQVLEEARLWQHLHVSSALNHCLLSTALILLQPKFSGEHTASRVLCCMSCTQDRQAFQGSIGPRLRTDGSVPSTEASHTLVQSRAAQDCSTVGVTQGPQCSAALTFHE